MKFLGFLKGQALQEAIAGIAVLVMPSVWEETAGLAAMEAMASARALIVADIGGLTETVGEAGIKFRPNNAADLVAAMARLVKDRRAVAELGRRARERAISSFDQRRMVHEHLSLYSDIAQ